MNQPAKTRSKANRRGRPQLWALGHSNRPWEDFLALLKRFQIERVADVRTIPRSRAVPWASQESLAPALAAAGIEYRHFKPLGGLRRPDPGSELNAGWRNSGFRGFADYMQTEEFKEALEDLLRLVRQRRTAILCAEAVPWRCHRSLIADAAARRGAEVWQIIGPGRARTHRRTPFARVRKGKLVYPAEAAAAVKPKASRTRARPGSTVRRV